MVRKPLTKEGALYHLRTIGSTGADYDRKSAELSKRFGHGASPGDVAWGLIAEATARTTGLQELKMIYWHKAMFLNLEGRNPTEAMRQSHEMQLRFLLQIGVATQVRILAAAAACEACRRQHDRLLTIAQALREQPLPCQACTHKLNEDDTHCWCRCEYVAEIE